MSVLRRFPEPFLDKNSLAEEVYTVTEYISLLNVKLKPLRATIQGEIRGVTYSHKAVYFSLHDKSGSVISCLIWLSRLNSLGIDPKDGLEVKAQGYPDVYPQYGKLTFKVDVLTPVGEGALRLALEKLKKDLQEQGYFAHERKRILPPYIDRVGLLTSETGVVKRDFLTGLGKFGIKVYFYDVRVEGQNAIESICTGIQWFNQNTNNVQALILARGGGSLEQLQPFNTIEVAKAIYSSRIPIVTAIGHELDTSIADLVADLRASVPQDASTYLSKDWRQAAERLDIIEQNIISRFINTCRELERRLSLYHQGFINCYAQSLSHNRKQVDLYSNTLLHCFRDVLIKVEGIEADFIHNFERFLKRIANRKSAIAAHERSIFREGDHLVASTKSKFEAQEAQYRNSYSRFARSLRYLIENISDRDVEIKKAALRWYKGLNRRIIECEQILLTHDPRLKLKQGYSVVKDQAGRILRSSKSVQRNDIIYIELYEGNLQTKIEKID